jgi:4-alpha-glucanotransferase
MRRLEHAGMVYDAIRIDHFHGFCSYYAIPYKDKDALHGIKEDGPGMDFFRVVNKRFSHLELIAEDLGEVTPDNLKLLHDTGIPGMKILQYAFTSWDSMYMPHKLEKNCVIYTGTHDNPPTRAWLETLNEGEVNFTRRYIRSYNTDFNALTWDLIREAMHSVADLCIIPLQDYLCKGKEARINTPGTAQGNWTWRIPHKFLSRELAAAIHEIAATYGRIPPRKEEKK